MFQQVITALIGVWLAAAPAVLSLEGAPRMLHCIAGPLIASIAVIAVFDLGRPLRWLNAAIAILFSGIAVMPPFLSAAGTANAVLAALAVTSLAVRAPVAPRQPYGGGWRVILR